MVLLTSLLWGLLTILGLRSPTDSPPTDLSGGSSCNGLEVRNGRVSCSHDGHQQVCQVVCDGKDQGEFTCTQEEGWSRELPTCARPIDADNDHYDYAEVAAQADGCPYDRSCALRCRDKGMPYGKCEGDGRMTCKCYG